MNRGSLLYVADRLAATPDDCPTLDPEDRQRLTDAYESLRGCTPDPDEFASAAQIDEAAEGLIGYVLTFQDRGQPLGDAVQAWAEEWDLI